MGIKSRHADGTADIRVSPRYMDLIDGTLSVEDLDIEELARGQLKDKDGKFRGRPPTLLPRQLVDAMRKEHYKRVNAVLEESLSDMVKTMREIALDPDQDGATRLKAAIYVYERFMGKTPDRVDISTESKIDDLVNDILYDAEADKRTPIEKELDLAEEELRDTEQRATRRRSPATRQRRRRD